MKSPERRVYRRTRVLREVEVRTNAEDAAKATHQGRMVDLSCGGLLAVVDEPVDVGTRCSVEISGIDAKQEPLHASGDVRSSRKRGGGNLVGIAFDEPMISLGDVRENGGADLSPEKRPKPLVLIIDDEPSVRTVLDRFVSRRGYRVQTAADAIEALEAMRKELPGLLMLDLRLPGVTGLQLLELMRSEGLKVGAIWAISGYATDREALTALQLGATDFINKPFDLDHLDWSLRLHEPTL